MEPHLSTFSKPSIDVKQQLALLQKRGLIIQDTGRAQRYLEVISFFRLSAYMRPFQVPNDVNHTFKQGTEFKEIVALYAFDRELRLIIMDAVERVEVAIRAMVNNVMGPTNQSEEQPRSGSHWYLKRNSFNRSYDHQRLLDTLTSKQEQEKRALQLELDKINKAGHDPDKKVMLSNLKQRENYCRYYANNYNEPKLPPCWAVIEELTLGELSHLYKGLKRDVERKAIAHRFKVPQDKLASWLHTLTFIRNCCAHHARLWNRELSIAPALMRDPEWQFPAVLPNSQIQPAKRLFSVILLLSYLMKQVSPDSKWVNNLLELFKKYPCVPIRSMGFPDDWQQHPFLQEVI